ncbi:gp615 [Bacillus phage G]|uniref:Gp615 n=1 Tax=Bacillus phage G TaxID=2884420 RepID=G3MAZ5_9CAUD|nr:gp615 [Bacillus phage G]AEO93860.1 gp615 [Bacillus phage G]
MEYLFGGEVSVKEVNGEEIVVCENFDTKEALEYMQEEMGEEEELNKILSNMEITYVEHPREEDGCPGVYMKLKGKYKGESFDLEINYDDHDEEAQEAQGFPYINAPQELKEDINKFMWGGDWTTALFWT